MANKIKLGDNIYLWTPTAGVTKSVVISCHGLPSRSARWRILSSMSVMFDTRRTLRPDHSR